MASKPSDRSSSTKARARFTSLNAPTWTRYGADVPETNASNPYERSCSTSASARDRSEKAPACTRHKPPAVLLGAADWAVVDVAGAGDEAAVEVEREAGVAAGGAVDVAVLCEVAACSVDGEVVAGAVNDDAAGVDGAADEGVVAGWAVDAVEAVAGRSCIDVITTGRPVTDWMAYCPSSQPMKMATADTATNVAAKDSLSASLAHPPPFLLLALRRPAASSAIVRPSSASMVFIP